MDRDGDAVRALLETRDPEVLRVGLRALGWPSAVADEQAHSMRLGLSGIAEQMDSLAKKYPNESPGPYETLSGVRYGKRPSPRQVYRKSMER